MFYVVFICNCSCLRVSHSVLQLAVTALKYASGFIASNASQHSITHANNYH